MEKSLLCPVCGKEAELPSTSTLVAKMLETLAEKGCDDAAMEMVERLSEELAEKETRIIKLEQERDNLAENLDLRMKQVENLAADCVRVRAGECAMMAGCFHKDRLIDGAGAREPITNAFIEGLSENMEALLQDAARRLTCYWMGSRGQGVVPPTNKDAVRCLLEAVDYAYDAQWGFFTDAEVARYCDNTPMTYDEWLGTYGLVDAEMPAPELRAGYYRDYLTDFVQDALSDSVVMSLRDTLGEDVFAKLCPDFPDIWIIEDY